MELIRLFHEGGTIMYPLLLCSVISFVVFLDKIITLRRFSKEEKKLSRSFKEALHSESLNLDQFHEIVTFPYNAIYEYQYLEKKGVSENVARHVDKVGERLKSNLWMIGTVASASPFIGLIGTVLGIIKSFKSISEAGKGGFAIVAADLSEALVATAAGIIVAVIALLFFNYVKVKINQVISDYHFNLENNIELFFRKK